MKIIETSTSIKMELYDMLENEVKPDYKIYIKARGNVNDKWEGDQFICYGAKRKTILGWEDFTHTKNTYTSDLAVAIISTKAYHLDPKEPFSTREDLLVKVLKK